MKRQPDARTGTTSPPAGANGQHSAAGAKNMDWSRSATRRLAYGDYGNELGNVRQANHRDEGGGHEHEPGGGKQAPKASRRRRASEAGHGVEKDRPNSGAGTGSAPREGLENASVSGTEDLGGDQVRFPQGKGH